MATQKELREEAKRLGLKGYSKKKNAELTAMIAAATAVAPREQAPEIIPEKNDLSTNNNLVCPNTFAEYIGSERIKARGFWKKHNKLIRENILLWVKWYELKFGIGSTEKEKWYNVTGQMINDNGGSGFFTTKAENSFKESIVEFVKFVYPDFPWKPYMFKQPPQGYWKLKENRESWFQDFCHDQSIHSLEDYYKITTSIIESSRLGMGPLPSYYKDSILQMLEDLCSYHTWLPWRLAGQVPQRYWNEHANVLFWFRTEILEPNHLITEEGEIQFEKLYQFTTKRIHDAYGQGVIVHKFNGSILNLFKYLFPLFNWQFWKFVSAPNNAWDNLENIKKYLNEEVGIKSPEELYDYSLGDLPSSLQKYSTMYDLCNLLYPTIVWNREKFHIWGFSRKACRFMDRLSIAISHPILHALNGKEFQIPGTRMKADGYIESEAKKFVIEYHGCYYHGCPHCYQHDDRKKISMNGLTHEQNYVRTCERTKLLRELGFCVVEMWECLENCDDLVEWWKSRIADYTT